MKKADLIIITILLCAGLAGFAVNALRHGHSQGDPRADIYVDGAFIGTAPVSLTVDAGTHTISASKSGYKSQTIEITVAEGEERPLLMFLQVMTKDPLDNLPAIP